MEEKIIKIKSYEKTSGKKKDNTEWHRISIKATDGKFYSTFNQIPESALRVGAELKVQVNPSSKISNTYDIKKIIPYTPTKPNEPEVPITPASTDVHAQLESADLYARDLFERAVQMVHEANPEWEGMSEYPYLIATLIQTMHGRITNIEIAAQNEKKYKMWGKKV